MLEKEIIDKKTRYTLDLPFLSYVLYAQMLEIQKQCITLLFIVIFVIIITVI